MLKKYIHFTFLFFLIVALSGVLLRLYPLLSNPNIPYDHLLHAHSHLALLGWEFLAAFIIFLVIFRREIVRKKHALTICCTLVIVSFAMFFAFLYEGYGIFSIITSTLHIFVEYWAAIFIYQTIKKKKCIPSLYIKGGLIALVISSLGPYALAVISANGWKEHALFDMSVYFYLHFQYNGWLTIFLIGTFLIILQMKKIPLNEKLLHVSFWLYFIALFPSYLLSVLWVKQFGKGVHFVGTVGSIGQWISIIIMLFAINKSSVYWKKHFSSLTNVSIKFSLFILFIKSSLELGLISPHLATLVYDTRSVIIGYLHLTLLGFISIFILAQFLMLKILVDNVRAKISFTIFSSGLIVMELLLFLEGLTKWLGLATFPFYIEGLLFTAVLLAVGVLAFWMTVNRNGKIYTDTSFPSDVPE